MKGPTNSSARPNIRLMDQSITFSANDDVETNLAFPYRASVEDARINHYMSATVIFDPVQAATGNYATFCQTYDGGVYIYAKTDPGTITVPAVSCDIAVSYADMDDTPTSGSNIPITSDGVYDALENKLTKGASLTDGHLLEWDGTNQKAVDAGKNVSDFGTPNTVVSNSLTSGSLTLGSNNYNLVSLVAPTAGKYLLQVNGQIQCSSLSGTRLLIGYNVNTTSSAHEWIDARNPINHDWFFTCTKLLTLSANDTVRICGTQDSITSAAIRGIYASLIRLA